MKRPSTLLTAVLALTALFGVAPRTASGAVDALTATPGTPFSYSDTTSLPTGLGFGDFQALEPVHAYRVWLSYNRFATWSSSNGCQSTADANNGTWGQNDPFIELMGSLHADGIVPVIQLGRQPDASVTTMDTQVCEVRWLMDAMGSLSYLIPGSNAVMLESYNEPDFGTIEAQQAAQFTEDTIYGASLSSFFSKVGFLGGTFGNAGDTSYWSAYYKDLGSDSSYLSAWDFHDYSDSNDPHNLQWCTYTGSSYSGCTKTAMQTFENWSYTSNGGNGQLPIWVTEIGGAGTLQDGPCADGSGSTGLGLCGLHDSGGWGDARVATDAEYLTALFSNIPFVFWYQYGPISTDWWDTGLLNQSGACERASWYVLAYHVPTSTAVADAGSCTN